MEIKKEHEEMIVNFGVFDYDAEKISNILGVNRDIIQKELNIKHSPLNQLLKKGKDMADYVIDLKLFEMSKSGDMKALEKLNERMRMRSNSRNRRYPTT